jgi:hypothetical protein
MYELTEWYKACLHGTGYITRFNQISIYTFCDRCLVNSGELSYHQVGRLEFHCLFTVFGELPIGNVRGNKPNLYMMMQ